MKRLLLFAALAFSALHCYAQVDQTTVGPGYTQQTYYSLSSGESSSVNHDSWDLAFSTNPMDAGIFHNDGASLGGGAISAYLLSGTDYANPDTSGMQLITSQEQSWSAGAFNLIADPSNPFDMGWGNYDVVTHSTTGTKVFVIEKRDGTMLKLMVESLVDGVYTIKYANLDGSNEQTAEISKMAFGQRALVYFSFDSNEAVDLEPSTWDLMFTRYKSFVENPGQEGEFLDYGVTGVLCNTDMLVASASGIDPTTANHEDYAFSSDIDAIGSDWKTYIAPTWVIFDDVVYWVKTQADELWKVQFLDFEGSATGTITLEKTFLGTFTSTESTNELQSENSLILYPNPSQGTLNLAIESKDGNKSIDLTIYNQLGQRMDFYQLPAGTGLNVHRLNLDYPAGFYRAEILVDGQQMVRSFVLQ